ncbi:hypothetical protein ASD78_03235 [Lysobacter sp. Root667]|uniref:hypothetical protein n=1 Tax=Lysobacter sp. Root667 TaxID=1736581 RepID=UPI0006FA85B5|nr:hypothetical protein [Lysobacter sp. Root667]KRA76669.1 hypothetical protein ASD78_03235 [Lysobacter sp. Root667]
MAIRTERVLLTVCTLLAVGIIVIAVWASRQALPTQPRKAPWVSIPAESEFSGDQSSRAALLSVAGMGRESTDTRELAYFCGDASYRHIEERYVAIFDVGAFEPAYRVSFNIQGMNALVEVNRAPRWLATGQSGFHRTYSADIHELAKIQEAWSDPAVWLSPQTDQICIPGGNSVLQSCVHGRYTLSKQDCTNTAVQKLQRAIASQFPLQPNDR